LAKNNALHLANTTFSCLHDKYTNKFLKNINTKGTGTGLNSNKGGSTLPVTNQRGNFSVLPVNPNNGNGGPTMSIPNQGGNTPQGGNSPTLPVNPNNGNGGPTMSIPNQGGNTPQGGNSSTLLVNPNNGEPTMSIPNQGGNSPQGGNSSALPISLNNGGPTSPITNQRGKPVVPPKPAWLKSLNPNKEVTVPEHSREKSTAEKKVGKLNRNKYADVINCLTNSPLRTPSQEIATRRERPLRQLDNNHNTVAQEEKQENIAPIVVQNIAATSASPPPPPPLDRDRFNKIKLTSSRKEIRPAPAESDSPKIKNDQAKLPSYLKDPEFFAQITNRRKKIIGAM
jgi:hypothetical protein